MLHEIVRTWMTPDPITITPETRMHQAQKIMLEKGIRRLPVLDGKKLVGILTYGDIREAEPSDATSLSVYELNYLITKLEIKEIMTPNPIFVEPEASIGKAAKLMLDNKIGGLPVVEDHKLVGIITETDFCRLLVEQSEQLLAN